MKIKQAVQHFLNYHRTNSKKNTYRNCSHALGYFRIKFGDKESEVAFIPQKIADRLKEYIQTTGIISQARFFPISYTAAGSIVVKTGKLVGIPRKTETEAAF